MKQLLEPYPSRSEFHIGSERREFKCSFVKHYQGQYIYGRIPLQIKAALMDRGLEETACILSWDSAVDHDILERLMAASLPWYY